MTEACIAVFQVDEFILDNDDDDENVDIIYQATTTP